MESNIENMREYLDNLMSISRINESQPFTMIYKDIEDLFPDFTSRREKIKLMHRMGNVIKLSPGIKLLAYHYIKQLTDELTLKKIEKLSKDISINYLTSYVTAYCYLCDSRVKRDIPMGKIKTEEGLTISLFNLMSVAFYKNNVYIDREELKGYFYESIDTVKYFINTIDPENILNGDTDKLRQVVDNNIDSSLDIIFSHINKNKVYMLEDRYYNEEE